MEVLYAILVLLAAFIVITLIRAIFFKEKKRDNAVLEPEMVDLDKYCRDLSDAIKIKTISNYDRELVDWNEFDKFHAFLEERFPLVHKTMTKTKVADASLVFKWEGTDSSLNGIALLAHQDVVPITAGTENDWEHEPFSGYNDGEFIWGRGAMDMKNHLIAVMECMEELINEGYKPKRSIYICLGHNEEVVAAPDNGAKQIAAYLKEQGVHLEAVLDEGGAILPVKLGKLLDINLTGVGIAEKGSVNYRVSVNAKGGHSSQPPKHTAVGKLADVIRDIENHQFKAEMPDYLQQLITRVGKNAGYPLRVVLVNSRLLRPLILAICTKIPAAASLVRTCTAVTMAEGSPQFNVLPQKASVTVNFRTMPGVSIADVEKHIRDSVKNKDIDVEFLVGKESSMVSPTNTRAFETIKELAEASNSKNLVIPFLVMGGTDAYNYEPVCENIYRFAPFVADTKLLLCTHGTNERIPIACCEDAIAFFKRYTRKMTQD